MKTKRMTAKEKAKELIDSYSFVYITNFTTIQDVKRCVLIAIDEICNAIDWHDYETPNKELEYWYEVLREVNCF